MDTGRDRLCGTDSSYFGPLRRYQHRQGAAVASELVDVADSLSACACITALVRQPTRQCGFRHAAAPGAPAHIRRSGTAHGTETAKRSSAGRKIKDIAADAPVYSLNVPEGFRLYSVNFYTADCLRPVEAAALPDLPQGSVVIYNSLVADSTLFGSSYSHMHLTNRSADHRNPLSLAIKN